MIVFDAHIHVWESAEQVNLNECRCICNGTGPSNWEQVKHLGNLFPGSVIPFFGVHPLFVNDLPDNWLPKMKEYLAVNSYGIGEIGLDGSGRKSDMGKQESVFITQLEVAAELSLPVSIHCVRSWGKMVAILRNYYPQENTSFMIHSFSGSEETMNECVNLGGYISFSLNLMKKKSEKIRRCLEHVPLDRILLESDSSKTPHSYRDQLMSLYTVVSGIKGIDLDELYRLVWRNGTVFTDRITSR